MRDLSRKKARVVRTSEVCMPTRSPALGRGRRTCRFILALAGIVLVLTPASAAAADPVIAAAGDIACDPNSSSFMGGKGISTECRQKYTSDLLVGAGLSAVLPLGDTQYENGGDRKFLKSYDP